MNNPSTRPTRSRVSSPFMASAKKMSAESAKTRAKPSERSQNFLDGWVEPVLPTPRPSFADAGIERHGVLQNMAPLGSRPSLKIMKAAALLEGADALGRSWSAKKAVISNASNATTPSESMMTPEPAAQTQEEASAPVSVLDELLSLPPTSPRKSTSISAIESQIAEQDIPVLEQTPCVIDNSITDSAPSRREFSQSPVIPPATGADGLPLINLAQTDRVVEAAVQEALERQRWPTAYALRTLYDDNRSNVAFIRLLEAVYYRYATEKEVDEFEQLLKPKKREGRKNRTGECYLNDDGSDPSPSRPIFSTIKALNPPAPAYRTPYTQIPPNRSTSVTKDDPTRSSPVNHSLAAPSPPKDDETAHVDKKPRSNSYEGSISEINGDTLPSINFQASKTRSHSHSSSSSSLSDVDVNLIGGISVSPLRPISTTTTTSTLATGLANATLGLFNFGGGAQPVFVSPYASANNFQAAASSADTLARSLLKPITATNPTPKPGPKIHTFAVTSTTWPTASSTSSSSSSFSSSNIINNNNNHNNNTINADDVNKFNNKTIATSKQDTSTASTEPSMAAAGLINSALNTLSGSKKRRHQDKIEATSYDANDERSTKRRKAKEHTNISTSSNIKESYERGPKLENKRGPGTRNAQVIASQDTDTASEGGECITVVPPMVKGLQKVRLNHNKESGSNRKHKINYESDDSSPTELGFRPDLAPGSLPTSRAGTPSNGNRLSRKAKIGTGLRVKTSSIKKKGGTSAGIARASGERNSPARNGANQEDNDDYCSSCGGNGELVCCDGDDCKRSFHFKCVDPPIMPDALPDTAWFCNSCRVKRDGYEDESTGCFQLLMRQMEEKNPSAFKLPEDIREYFVDVKTGLDGEYEEVVHSKPKSNNRVGWEETPDYFRKKDNKGKAILCHKCGLQAEAPDRVIIPCTFCGLYWHLDCCEVPLAKEPAPGRTWQCDAHVDDLLRLIPHQLAPAHRFRKIKVEPALKPTFSRGVKNHGHIYIENDQTDEEEEQPAFYEERPFGLIPKLSETSIKLDFLSKVKREGGQYTRARYGYGKPTVKQKRNQFMEVSLIEKQAALNLVALTTTSTETTPSITQHLINTLLAEAPPAVLILIAQGDSNKIAASQSKLQPTDKQALEALRALIDSKLEALDDSGGRA